MTEYHEDEYLQISGLQHFSFCRRQWALIHIEQQWAENLRTVEGDLLHEKAHDETLSESRGDLLVIRGLSVASAELGVSGSCDVVEFHASDSGVSLAGRGGRWVPYPVEYKRGVPKAVDADRLQLCCQAICLEKMLSCEIPKGALYYNQPRRREPVSFTAELRDNVTAMLAEMHELYRRRHTPKVKTGAFCRACSLGELCIPKLCKNASAAAYLAKTLSEVNA